MFTIGQTVFTNDNDQAKPAGEDYLNVKPKWITGCIHVQLGRAFFVSLSVPPI